MKKKDEEIKSEDDIFVIGTYQEKGQALSSSGNQVSNTLLMFSQKQS